jgi:hypothetical protein
MSETKSETKANKLPKLPTKQSFAKKRPFFADSSARKYYKCTTRLPQYLKNRLASITSSTPSLEKDGKDGKDNKEVAVFWVVLTGSQQVPAASSTVLAIVKAGAEGKAEETSEVQFLDTSSGKYLKTLKTGWVIAQVSKDFSELLQKSDSSVKVAKPKAKGKGKAKAKAKAKSKAKTDDTSSETAAAPAPPLDPVAAK